MTFPCSSVEVRYSQSSSSGSGDWSTKEARKAELVKGRSGARGAVLPGDKRGSTNPTLYDEPPECLKNKVASGGNAKVIECARPWRGIGTASRPPRLPHPLPPY
jgi:hypothetical protein